MTQTVDLEKLIIKNLCQREAYFKKIRPIIDNYDYFSHPYDKFVKLLFRFYDKFKKIPNRDSMSSIICKVHVTEEIREALLEALDISYSPIDENQCEEWLEEETITWLKFRAHHLAILESYQILEQDVDKLDEEDRRRKQAKNMDMILGLFKDAANKFIIDDVGHELFKEEDILERHNFYTGKGSDVEKIPFRIEQMNKITNGGVETRSLNVIAGGTGGGKTLTMCSLATDYLREGYDVLYITAEMDQIKIAHRIEANLLNILLDEFKFIPLQTYEENLERIHSKVNGKLVIKRYKPRECSANHIESLLDELRVKKNFKPKVIMFDYLGLLRTNDGYRYEMYERGQILAEELRAVAIEHNIAMWSAVQLKRDGLSKSDLDADDIAESFAISHAADFMIGVYADEDLIKQAKLKIAQMSKNRYADITIQKSFLLSCERGKMRISDIDSGWKG